MSSREAIANQRDTTGVHDAVGVVERALAELPAEQIPVEVVQRLLQLGVQTYYEMRAADVIFGPFLQEGVVTATAGIVAAANILEAVEVEVFEFSMFKTLAEG